MDNAKLESPFMTVSYNLVAEHKLAALVNINQPEWLISTTSEPG